MHECTPLAACRRAFVHDHVGGGDCFNPALFGATIPAGTTPDTRAVLTTDEESSGIVQLPGGAYLFDAQVHTAKNLPAGTGPGTIEKLVENGQLLRMWIPDFSKVHTEFD